MRSFLLFVMVIMAFATAVARDPDYVTKNSEGREFWLCFMKNFREQGPRDGQNRQEALKLQLFITSSFDATVRIEIEEIMYDNTISIRANTVVNVQIPARAQLRAVETGERLAVHVTSDTAISVYGLNSRFQTTDTFLGLPVSVLGTQYRAVGYTKLASDLLSAVSIVATEDGTEITITPTAATSTGHLAGRPFTANLRKGDVYTIGARWESIGACDLTGTLVTSNKKIAVFSGHNCAYVPPKVEACNHLVEQLPPVTAWGKHYYLGMLKERSRFTYRVISSQDGTKVFEDAKLVAILKAGEFFENLNLSRHVQVTADKPILVAQFAQGFKNGDSVGDPMMILVSPTQQFLKEYRIATPISGDWHHYINVVAPTTSINEIRINGRRLDSLQFVVLGESRYSIAQVPVPFGTHVVKSETPFGLYSYGFGYRADAYDAYGNMAGQSFFEINKLVDSLPPIAEGKKVRDYFIVPLREDRPMDKGIKSVKVLVASGLEAQIPKIEEGAPQVDVRIRQTVGGHTGRVVLRAEDVAGNVSVFTICYLFDGRSEHYAYQISEGTDAVCESEDAWIVGAYGTIGSTFHSVNMRVPEITSAQLLFNTQSIGTSWGGGLRVGRRLSQDFIVSGRIGLTTLGGTLLSPDSTISSVFDTAARAFVPYQEGTILSVNSPYMHIGAGVEWFPHRFFFINVGVQASLPIGTSVTVQRVILRPLNWVFAQGSTPQTIQPQSIGGLTAVQLGVYGGVGLAYPVSFSMSVFTEAIYTTWLGDVASHGPWTIDRLGLNVGVQYRW